MFSHSLVKVLPKPLCEEKRNLFNEDKVYQLGEPFKTFHSFHYGKLMLKDIVVIELYSCHNLWEIYHFSYEFLAR